MRAAVDLFSLAVGLVLGVVSGFFLLADDPSLDDVGRVLVPTCLVVAGLTLLIGSLRRRSVAGGPTPSSTGSHDSSGS